MYKILPLLLLLCCVIFNKVSAQVQLTGFTFAEGDKSSNPKTFIEFNRLFFFLAATTEDNELWVSDGTGANPRILKDINPGSAGGGSLFSTVVLGDQLFFIANDGEYGYQLWVTKGTTESTKRISKAPALSSNTRLTLMEQTFFSRKCQPAFFLHLSA